MARNNPSMDAPAANTAAVDLANLRLFTDGDREAERRFIGLFFLQSDEALKNIAAHCVDGESDPWSELAHSLKGAAANLGAEPLRLLCEQAQNAKVASALQRRQLLARIEDEMQRVRAHLRAEGLLTSMEPES